MNEFTKFILSFLTKFIFLYLSYWLNLAIYYLIIFQPAKEIFILSILIIPNEGK